MTDELLQLLSNIFSTCTEKFGNETTGQMDCLARLISEARDMKGQLEEEGRSIDAVYRSESAIMHQETSACYDHLVPLVGEMKIFDSIVCIPPKPVH